MTGNHKLVRLTIGNSGLLFHIPKQEGGIEMAAQKYCQLLHSHLNKWGDLLSPYGKRIVDARKEQERK
jgi:hypothetical protein